MPNAPLVDLIAEDPMLADTKIIAEAWDAAGAYQVGSFGDLRWAEWNGRYRDDVRRYWRGDPGMVGAMATRLSGSSDLYEQSGRAPYCSINFVTSHDGFTMNDLVSFKDKHNDANGEGNRDGDNNNCSDNYGAEGPTKKKGVEAIRTRQVKNMIASLMLSQGVPMLLMGDEVRRTQRGNNNAYCQDNEISWFNWNNLEQHPDIFRFTQGLIEFRKMQPSLRRERFLTGRPQDVRGVPDVSWFESTGKPIHWDAPDGTLVCWLGKPASIDDPEGFGRDILIMLNGTPESKVFTMPPQTRGIRWRLFADTSKESPKDLYPDLDGPVAPATRQIELLYRSTMIWVAEER
jgi:glycogen operon protein